MANFYDGCYEQAKSRVHRRGQNPEVIPHFVNEDEMQSRVTARLAHKSDVVTAALLASGKYSPFPKPEKPVQVVGSLMVTGDYSALEQRVLYGQAFETLIGAAELASNSLRDFASSIHFPKHLINKEFLMEEETVAGMSTGEWAQVPKRKRRFHLNAEKRAATNWAGTMKMLKLLAPCGVQCNAQALDIINAKYGI